MKAYLVTTGTLFGLIAVMHFLRSIEDWPHWSANRVEFLIMTLLGVVAAGLSIWAWRLLYSRGRP
jgi:drug/metabolite transporter (DMT)-like permease